MKNRERSADDRQDREGPDPTPDEPGANLPDLRRAGEDFLKAGDEAIGRALSGNSEEFLAANRQQGGE
jgi:hypothetical protein